MTAMRNRPNGIIVEFVGLAGSGKTTISRATARLLRQTASLVTEPAFDFSRSTTDITRKLQRLRLAAQLIVQQPTQTQKWIKLLLTSKQKSGRDYYHTLLDILLTCSLNRQHQAQFGVHIFDQGVFQAVWSILYSSTRQPQQSVIIDAAHRTFQSAPRTVLVFLEVQPNTCAGRLQRRPGSQSRMERCDSPEELKISMLHGVNVLAHVRQIAEGLADRLGDRFIVHALANDGADVDESALQDLSDQLLEIWGTSNGSAR